MYIGTGVDGGNFLHVQEFQATREYIRAGRELCVDEYMGIGYPLLIALAEGLGSLTGVPYYCFLYIMQLSAGFVSGCLFLWFCHFDGTKVFTVKNMAGSLYLLTIPMSMQCHMAVLPQSLLLSAFLMMSGLCISALRREREMTWGFWAWLCCLWFVSALLKPDYFWLAGFPVVWMLSVCIIRKGIWKRAVFLTLVTMLATGTVNAATTTPGSYGKIQKTVGAAMVSRLVWPNFSTTYFFWPQEVKEVMSPELAGSISERADEVQLTFGPLLEERFGREKANVYYWNMAMQCMQVRTRENLAAIGKDLMSYFCVPVSLKMQLNGMSGSYSGWNYGRMREAMPVLTKYYVRYSLWFFVIAGVCLAGIAVTAKPGMRETGGAMLTAAVIFQVLWYTMSGAGMMDYMNVPVVTALWFGGLLKIYEIKTEQA